MKLPKEFFTFLISHLHLTVLEVSTANGEQLELNTLSNSTCGSRQNVYRLQKHLQHSCSAGTGTAIKINVAFQVLPPHRPTQNARGAPRNANGGD